MNQHITRQEHKRYNRVHIDYQTIETVHRSILTINISIDAENIQRAHDGIDKLLNQKGISNGIQCERV